MIVMHGSSRDNGHTEQLTIITGDLPKVDVFLRNNKISPIIDNRQDI